MRPPQVFEFLKSTIEYCKDTPKGQKEYTPIMLWGAPGIGKSAIIKQLAQHLNATLLDIRMPLLDPSDLRGLPFPIDGVAKWLRPSFLPDPNDKRLIILFLDELPAAVPLVQNAAYQLVWDHAVGEYMLPENCMIVAAGNNITDRAATFKMPTPLMSRFTHIDFEANLDDFINYAIRNRFSAEVISNVKWRGDKAMFDFESFKKRDMTDKTFACPRTWEFVSRYMKMNLPREILKPAIEGAVGAPAAADFWAFLNCYSKLPDLDKILAGKSYEIPVELDVRYACVTSLAAKAKDENISALLKYANKLDSEFSVLLVKMLYIAHEKQLGVTAGYRDWLTEHIDDLKGFDVA